MATTRRLLSQSRRVQMPRLAPFVNAYDEISQLTPATIKRISQASRFAPNPKYFQSFTSTVVHTDGSTFTYQSALPSLTRVHLVKDAVHHPLWNPRISASQVDKSSEEFIKFRTKFVQSEGGVEEDVLASLAFSDTEAAPVEIKPKQPVVAQQTQKGKKRK